MSAAALLLVCGFLGPRKHMLRLRLGPIAAWVASHNALGLLALVLALLHCEFQRGGLLTSAMLMLLGLLVMSGLVGAVLQAHVPRVMTSRLARESGHRYFPALLAGHWRRVHDLVVGVCGPQEGAERELLRAERAAGIEARSPGDAATASTNPDHQAIASFYVKSVASFMRAPNARHSLASESEARLAIDALMASVDPSLHDFIAQLDEIVEEVRMCVEERRLHHLVFDWQLLHIPLAVLMVLLTAVHAFAALYY